MTDGRIVIDYQNSGIFHLRLLPQDCSRKLKPPGTRSRRAEAWWLIAFCQFVYPSVLFVYLELWASILGLVCNRLHEDKSTLCASVKFVNPAEHGSFYPGNPVTLSWHRSFKDERKKQIPWPTAVRPVPSFSFFSTKRPFESCSPLQNQRKLVRRLSGWTTVILPKPKPEPE